MTTPPRVLILFLGCAMMPAPILSQSLNAGRAVATGAYIPLQLDSRAFALNPAALTGVRDWEVTASTYLQPTVDDPGFVFHGLSFAKKFFGSTTVAFQYTPGTSLNFVHPPTIVIGPGNLPVSNDREIDYIEPFAVGVGHQLADGLSVGAVGRYRRETVQATQYEILVEDTVTIPIVFRTEDVARYWSMDLSVHWNPSESLTFTAVGRNLLAGLGSELPDGLSSYRLPTDVYGEFGAAVRLWRRLSVGGSVSTYGSGALGMEWTPGAGLACRWGFYADGSSSPFVTAGSLGAAWAYEFFEIEGAYLRFFDQSGRQGSTPAALFDVSEVRLLDFNPYTSDRIVLTIRAMFGDVRESALRIEGVTFTGPVYPASAGTLAYRPVGTARVRNVSDRPVEARVALFVERIMDEPTESRMVQLQPGQTVEVPLTAVFNEQIMRSTSSTVRDASVTVGLRPGGPEEDRLKAPILIHGKNAWDGDVLTLRFFVTPDAPDVIRYTRDALLTHRDSLAGVPGSLEQFRKATTLIDAFGGRLIHVADPTLSPDRVQFPEETLSLRSGDCDDMTVCFASLLGSIGVATAFVDVVPPDRPDSSHIFLLFDTGVDPRFGGTISPNPKRYVIRRNASGAETVWIPVETTVIAQGFDTAWSVGAQQYFDDVEVGLGLVRGWVRIVDVDRPTGERDQRDS